MASPELEEGQMEEDLVKQGGICSGQPEQSRDGKR
jgi:hypothetical protein